MEQNTASLYDDDLTVGMEETEDFLDTGFVDLFEHSSNNGSPISRLKTIVLSLDWEINNEILTQFNDELLALKEIWAGDQIKLVYVQALEKISKYIYQLKADAHPNAIKLLLTFYYNLEKIALGTDMTETETKEILREDIKKFEKLKQQIGVLTGTATAESGPEAGAALSETAQNEPHPVLFNLKACILGMDWEITERELTDLGKEIGRLEEEFAGRKPHMIFLQGIGALGGYIKLKKSDAHADAFKLLYSFYEGLEKIVVNPDLSREEVKGILLPEVEKFEDFKKIVASTITPEAIAEKIVDEQPGAYGDDDTDDVSPAFSDVPDEVHGFQAEEEAATLGRAPDDVDSRLDTFFSGDEKSAEPVDDGAGVLPPEAIEKIDSFFGDDIVDDALSVSSISAEDALKGVDVETEADDDSDEEALPTEDDGMLAPALADSAENEPHGFNPEIGPEESLYAATDVDDTINDIFAADLEDEVVTKAAALKGVDVESEADDDSAERPLPKEIEDIAPALAMEDIDSESEEAIQAGPEVSEIDAHIEGFFGEDFEDDEPSSVEAEASAQLDGASALSEVSGDEVVDIDESTEKLPEGMEDRLDSFFAEPDEDIGGSPDSLFGSEEDEVVFKAVDDEDSPIATEDIATGLLDEEIEFDSEASLEAVDREDESLAAFEAEAVAEAVDPEEESLAAFEAEAVAEAVDTEEESLAAFEAEAVAEDVDPEEESLAAFEAEVAEAVDPEEHSLTAFEAEAVAEDVGTEEETLTTFEVEALEEADSEDESLTAFDSEAAADGRADTEEEIVSDLESEFGTEDETVSSFGSDSEEEDFFAAIDDRVDEPGEIQIELLSETDKLESELVTEKDEIDGAEEVSEQQDDSVDTDLIETLSGPKDDEIQALSFAVSDELSELRAAVASLGVEINDNIIEGLLTEINRLRHRMMTKPAEKTFLQLLSTIVQHIGKYKYESSSDAHTLVLSVFDKLELSQKIETTQEQSQELLLAETCKVLLWQQKMLDRQTVKKGDAPSFPDSIGAEPTEEGAEGPIDADDEAVSAAVRDHDPSKQEFTAVFEPVDDQQEITAYENIETTQEGLEHELGDAFNENESELIDGEGGQATDSVSSEDNPQLNSIPESDNLPDVLREDEKLDIKGLSTILTDLVKREMKALKDLLQTELKALRNKLGNKDKE